MSYHIYQILTCTVSVVQYANEFKKKKKLRKWKTIFKYLENAIWAKQQIFRDTCSPQIWEILFLQTADSSKKGRINSTVVKINSN